MRKIIINSTPLIALCKVGRLSVLQALYGEVTIPEAVFREVSQKNDLVKEQILTADWIHIERPGKSRDKKMYSAKLHEGEVEVMLLAQEDEDHTVVIDDYAARKTAEYLGLHLTGTIGILLRAKKEGLIDAVRPIISQMEANGIYFSESLKKKVFAIAGEG